MSSYFLLFVHVYCNKYIKSSRRFSKHRTVLPVSICNFILCFVEQNKFFRWWKCKLQTTRVYHHTGGTKEKGIFYSFLTKPIQRSSIHLCKHCSANKDWRNQIRHTFWKVTRGTASVMIMANYYHKDKLSNGLTKHTRHIHTNTHTELALKIWQTTSTF